MPIKYSTRTPARPGTPAGGPEMFESVVTAIARFVADQAAHADVPVWETMSIAVIPGHPDGGDGDLVVQVWAEVAPDGTREEYGFPRYRHARPESVEMDDMEEIDPDDADTVPGTVWVRRVGPWQVLRTNEQGDS